MTMLDETALRDALRDATESVAVPDRVHDVIAAARALDVPSAAVRRWRGWRRWRPTRRGSTTSAPVVEGLTPRRPSGRRAVVGAVAATGLIGALVAVAMLGGSSNSAHSTANGPFRLSAPTTVVTPGVESLPPATTPGAGAAGSASGSTAQAPASGAASGPASGQAPPPLPSGSVGQSSKVEESGSLNLSVGKGRLDQVVTRLGALAVANGGFVADTQTQSGGGGAGYGSVTLQVPEDSFSSVVAQVQSLGTVTSLTTRGTDVTGQYVDLQSRIAALQASRDQYLTIMTKATSISDILAVQNQLDSLQSEIEQLQGQLQVLDSETTYGTLAVSLSEPGGHRPPPPAPRSGIGSAWHGAVSGFAAAFDGLVRIAGPLLFVLLLLLAVVLLGRIAWRTLRRHAL